MLVVGIVTAIVVMNTPIKTEVDTVAINEVMKITEQHWPNIEREQYASISLPFTILDSSETLIYYQAEEPIQSIHEAIQKRSTIIDMNPNGEAVGKLIVHHDDVGIIKDFKKKLSRSLMMVAIMVALFLTGYMLYINHRIIKPFKQLEGFANHIARGNLELPLEIVKHNPFGAFTESFDIMREELAAARKSEYEANRSKKELVASLSHDIKTPVASIKAISELMLITAQDEKTIKQLHTINAKAEQINLLITDMFHATLEELNELKVVVAEELSTIIHGMIESVNYDDQISCSTIPECIILTDANRLQQVLDNIISNAYKYAKTAVTIDARIESSFLELCIRDGGRGINGDELPLIFNKFYRGSNAKGYNGSGLGLYISQFLMHKMNGDIDCYNSDTGLTVVIKIPLA